MRVQKCEGARPSKGWLQERLGVCVAARAASQMLPALASTHLPQFYRSLKQSWKVTRLTRLTRLTRAPRTSRIRISWISESISILSESFSDSYFFQLYCQRFRKQAKEAWAETPIKSMENERRPAVASHSKAQSWKLQVFANGVCKRCLMFAAFMQIKVCIAVSQSLAHGHDMSWFCHDSVMIVYSEVVTFWEMKHYAMSFGWFHFQRNYTERIWTACYHW